MFLVSIIAIIGYIGTTSAADRCGSTAQPISPFNLDEYLGIWYQIAVNKEFYELTECRYPLCVFANYSMKGNDSVSVLNTGFNSDGDKNIAEGVATQPTANTGGLEVSFYGFPPGPYNVIKMIKDKKGKYSIALIYSCSKLGFAENLWLLSRERQIA